MDSTTMIIVGAAVVAVVLGAGVFLFMRMRGQAKATADEYHHFKCPGCGRKLRYRVRQIGHKGQCSHCGRDLVFPPVAKSAR